MLCPETAPIIPIGCSDSNQVNLPVEEAFFVHHLRIVEQFPHSRCAFPGSPVVIGFPRRQAIDGRRRGSACAKVAHARRRRPTAICKESPPVCALHRSTSLQFLRALDWYDKLMTCPA
jgi:hypothetical protein